MKSSTSSPKVWLPTTWGMPIEITDNLPIVRAFHHLYHSTTINIKTLYIAMPLLKILTLMLMNLPGNDWFPKKKKSVFDCSQDSSLWSIFSVLWKISYSLGENLCALVRRVSCIQHTSKATIKHDTTHSVIMDCILLKMAGGENEKKSFFLVFTSWFHHKLFP